MLLRNLLATIVLLTVATLAYVRLAPVDPARWHVDLATARPAALARPAADGKVQALAGGAYADLPLSSADATSRLTRLDAIALATPRTRRFAGNPAQGHVTWQTRSLIWGFPDYTTAQITPQGLTLYARLRFGGGDMGVNAKRLTGWLAAL